MDSEALSLRKLIVEEWMSSLSDVLAAMTDTKPSVDLENASEWLEPSEREFLWSQKFEPFSHYCFWVAASTSFVREFERLVPNGAGNQDPNCSPAENTFIEVLSQSFLTVSRIIGEHLGCNARATSGQPGAHTAEKLEWLPIRVGLSPVKQEKIWVAVSLKLLEALVSADDGARHQTSSAGAKLPVSSAVREKSLGEESKTFDLLLDVALPVSISFGRASLQVKEILKLTTGSIVELDRLVSEPVDVIVNNCVIATGEVVVVEGNYGVRVQQIASRFDRLKTGTSSVQAQKALNQH